MAVQPVEESELGRKISMKRCTHGIPRRSKPTEDGSMLQTVPKLPDLGVDRSDHHRLRIQDAAQATRRLWGYPEGPLPSVVDLLESHGVITVRLPDDVDRKVSAFSTSAGRRPLILLSQGREDRARSRFDASHELGHLLLHPDTEPGSKIVENQANMFASELLMPAAEIIDQLPRRIDWARFHELQKTWGVSLRALVYRAHALGVLSEASYRRANQQLAVWGLPEPGDLGLAESPRLLGWHASSSTPTRSTSTPS